MRTIYHFLVLMLQCIVTFSVLLTVYMIFVILDYQGGIDGLINTTFVQPVIGSIVAAVTMLICMFLGLPIRLIKKLNVWWSEKYFLSILGAFMGAFLLIISTLPALQQSTSVNIEGEQVTRKFPNTMLSLSGWFLTGFFLLHIFPPQRLRQWLRSKLAVIRGGILS